jgi:hypothetical protein
MTVFRAWATAAGSTDIRTLLQNPAALLQLMQEREYPPETSLVYLACVERVLTVEPVAALLEPEGLRELLSLLAAARVRYVKLCSAARRVAKRAAAAAADGAAGEAQAPTRKRSGAARRSAADAPDTAANAAAWMAQVQVPATGGNLSRTARAAAAGPDAQATAQTAQPRKKCQVAPAAILGQHRQQQQLDVQQQMDLQQLQQLLESSWQPVKAASMAVFRAW